MSEGREEVVVFTTMKLKLTAFFTLMVFLLTQTGLSQAAELIPAFSETGPQTFIPGKIEIPKELGTVESQHQASPEAPFVVILQDAHAIVAAQRQTQKLIEYFQKKYGIGLVAVEGGQGPMDTTLFRSFPDEIAKKKVLNGYLEKAEITGAEMAAVFGDPSGRYYGIEDWDLYEDNYLAYARAAKKKQAVLEQLQDLKTVLDQTRKTLFSPELNRFHERVEALRDEKINLTDFLKSFGAEASAPIPAVYPHLNTLIQSLSQEADSQKEDFDVSLRKMAAAFLEKARGRMDKKQAMVFNERFRAFQTGELDRGSFLKYLVETGGDLGFKPRLTTPMQALLGNFQRLVAIKGSRLSDELEKFILERQAALAKTPSEQALVEKYRRWGLLRDLASLELTHDQLAEYQKDASGYLSFLGDSSGMITPALEFYELALKRDQSFRGNLRELLKNQKSKAAVVLAGGFHTRGFEENLKAEGYSYAVIMPKIDSLEGKDQYAEIMRGNLSYKPYLQTTFYDAFVRASTVKLVAELSARDFKRNLKVWRDEVIRQLAREGRIAEAGRYTDYIDLLFKVYYDKFGDEAAGLSREAILKTVETELQKIRKQKTGEIWNRFEAQLAELSRGLKILAGRKELNLQNVSQLLETVSQPKVSGTAQLGEVTMMPGVSMRSEMRNFIMTGALSEKSAQRTAWAAPVAAPDVILSALDQFARGGASAGISPGAAAMAARLEAAGKLAVRPEIRPATPRQVAAVIGEGLTAFAAGDQTKQEVASQVLKTLEPGTANEPVALSKENSGHFEVRAPDRTDVRESNRVDLPAVSPAAPALARAEVRTVAGVLEHAYQMGDLRVQSELSKLSKSLAEFLVKGTWSFTYKPDEKVGLGIPNHIEEIPIPENLGQNGFRITIPIAPAGFYEMEGRTDARDSLDLLLVYQNAQLKDVFFTSLTPSSDMMVRLEPSRLIFGEERLAAFLDYLKESLSPEILKKMEAGQPALGPEDAAGKKDFILFQTLGWDKEKVQEILAAENPILNALLTAHYEISLNLTGDILKFVPPQFGTHVNGVMDYDHSLIFEKWGTPFDQNGRSLYTDFIAHEFTHKLFQKLWEELDGRPDMKQRIMEGFKSRHPDFFEKIGAYPQYSHYDTDEKKLEEFVAYVVGRTAAGDSRVQLPWRDEAGNKTPNYIDEAIQNEDLKSLVEDLRFPKALLRSEVRSSKAEVPYDVRLVDPADFPDLSKIALDLSEKSKDAKESEVFWSIASSLESPSADMKVWAAQAQGKTLGFRVTSRMNSWLLPTPLQALDPQGLIVGAFAVIPEARNQGIGKKLLEESFNYFKNFNDKKIRFYMATIEGVNEASFRGLYNAAKKIGATMRMLPPLAENGGKYYFLIDFFPEASIAANLPPLLPSDTQKAFEQYSSFSRSEVREGVKFRIAGYPITLIQKEGRYYATSDQAIFADPLGREKPKKRVLLDPQQYIFPIGRDWRSAIRLTDNRVSAHHALLIRDFGGSFQLVDLASAQGTAVAGKKIDAVHFLSMGGPVEARFKFNQKNAQKQDETQRIHTFVYMMGGRYFIAFYDSIEVRWQEKEIPFSPPETGSAFSGALQGEAVLGSDESSEIHIQDHTGMVPKQALKFSLLTNGEVMVENFDSEAGQVLLNGKPLVRGIKRIIYDPVIAQDQNTLKQAFAFEPYEHFEEMKQLMRDIMFLDASQYHDDAKAFQQAIAQKISLFNNLLRDASPEAVIMLKLAMTVGTEEDKTAKTTRAMEVYLVPFLKHFLYQLYSLKSESMKASGGLAILLALFLTDQSRKFPEYKMLQFEAARAFNELQFAEPLPVIKSKMIHLLNEESARKLMGPQLMGAIRNLDGLDDLLNMIRNSDREHDEVFRAQAIEALVNNRAKLGNRESEVAAMLMALTYDDSEKVVVAALRGLETMGKVGDAAVHFQSLVRRSEQEELSEAQKEAERIWKAYESQPKTPPVKEGSSSTANVSIDLPSTQSSGTGTPAVDPTQKMKLNDLFEDRDADGKKPGNEKRSEVRSGEMSLSRRRFLLAAALAAGPGLVLGHWWLTSSGAKEVSYDDLSPAVRRLVDSIAAGIVRKGEAGAKDPEILNFFRSGEWKKYFRLIPSADSRPHGAGVGGEKIVGLSQGTVEWLRSGNPMARMIAERTLVHEAYHFLHFNNAATRGRAAAIEEAETRRKSHLFFNETTYRDQAGNEFAVLIVQNDQGIPQFENREGADRLQVFVNAYEGESTANDPSHARAMIFEIQKLLEQKKYPPRIVEKLQREMDLLNREIKALGAARSEVRVGDSFASTPMEGSQERESTPPQGLDEFFRKVAMQAARYDLGRRAVPEDIIFLGGGLIAYVYGAGNKAYKFLEKNNPHMPIDDNWLKGMAEIISLAGPRAAATERVQNVSLEAYNENPARRNEPHYILFKQELGVSLQQIYGHILERKSTMAVKAQRIRGLMREMTALNSQLFTELGLIMFDAKPRNVIQVDRPVKGLKGQQVTRDTVIDDFDLVRRMMPDGGYINFFQRDPLTGAPLRDTVISGTVEKHHFLSFLSGFLIFVIENDYTAQRREISDAIINEFKVMGEEGIPLAGLFYELLNTPEKRESFVDIISRYRVALNNPLNTNIARLAETTWSQLDDFSRQYLGQDSFMTYFKERLIAMLPPALSQRSEVRTQKDVRPGSLSETAMAGAVLKEIKAVGYNSLIYLHPSQENELKRIGREFPPVSNAVLTAGYAFPSLLYKPAAVDEVNALIRSGFALAGDGAFVKRDANHRVVIIGERHAFPEGEADFFYELNHQKFNHVVLELHDQDQDNIRAYLKGTIPVSELLPDLNKAAKPAFVDILNRIQDLLARDTARNIEVHAFDPKDEKSDAKRDEAVARGIQGVLEDPEASVLVLRGFIHLDPLLKLLNPDMAPLKAQADLRALLDKTVEPLFEQIDREIESKQLPDYFDQSPQARKGIYSATFKPYFRDVFPFFYQEQGKNLVVLDAGHGAGHFAMMLGAANRPLLNGKIKKIIGIEERKNLFDISQRVSQIARERNLIQPNEIEFHLGDFNSAESLEFFKQADVVYYYGYGTEDTQGFSKTLQNLKAGARVIIYGPILENGDYQDTLHTFLNQRGQFDYDARSSELVHVYVRRSEVRSGGGKRTWEAQVTDAAVMLRNLGNLKGGSALLKLTDQGPTLNLNYVSMVLVLKPDDEDESEMSLEKGTRLINFLKTKVAPGDEVIFSYGDAARSEGAPPEIETEDTPGYNESEFNGRRDYGPPARKRKYGLDFFGPVPAILNETVGNLAGKNVVELGATAESTALLEELQTKGASALAVGYEVEGIPGARKVEDYNDFFKDIAPDSLDAAVARLSFYPRSSEKFEKEIFSDEERALIQSRGAEGLLRELVRDQLWGERYLPLQRALKTGGVFIQVMHFFETQFIPPEDKLSDYGLERITGSWPNRFDYSSDMDKMDIYVFRKKAGTTPLVHEASVKVLERENAISAVMTLDNLIPYLKANPKAVFSKTDKFWTVKEESSFFEVGEPSARSEVRGRTGRDSSDKRGPQETAQERYLGRFFARRLLEDETTKRNLGLLVETVEALMARAEASLEARRELEQLLPKLKAAMEPFSGMAAFGAVKDYAPQNSGFAKLYGKAVQLLAEAERKYGIKPDGASRRSEVRAGQETFFGLDPAVIIKKIRDKGGMVPEQLRAEEAIAYDAGIDQETNRQFAARHPLKEGKQYRPFNLLLVPFSKFAEEFDYESKQAVLLIVDAESQKLLGSAYMSLSPSAYHIMGTQIDQAFRSEGLMTRASIMLLLKGNRKEWYSDSDLDTKPDSDSRRMYMELKEDDRLDVIIPELPPMIVRVKNQAVRSEVRSKKKTLAAEREAGAALLKEVFRTIPGAPFTSESSLRGLLGLDLNKTSDLKPRPFGFLKAYGRYALRLQSIQYFMQKYPRISLRDLQEATNDRAIAEERLTRFWKPLFSDAANPLGAAYKSLDQWALETKGPRYTRVNFLLGIFGDVLLNHQPEVIEDLTRPYFRNIDMEMSQKERRFKPEQPISQEISERKLARQKILYAAEMTRLDELLGKFLPGGKVSRDIFPFFPYASEAADGNVVGADYRYAHLGDAVLNLALMNVFFQDREGGRLDDAQFREAIGDKHKKVRSDENLTRSLEEAVLERFNDDEIDNSRLLSLLADKPGGKYMASLLEMAVADVYLQNEAAYGVGLEEATRFVRQFVEGAAAPVSRSETRVLALQGNMNMTSVETVLPVRQKTATLEDVLAFAQDYADHRDSLTDVLDQFKGGKIQTLLIKTSSGNVSGVLEGIYYDAEPQLRTLTLRIQDFKASGFWGQAYAREKLIDLEMALILRDGQWKPFDNTDIISIEPQLSTASFTAEPTSFFSAQGNFAARSEVRARELNETYWESAAPQWISPRPDSIKIQEPSGKAMTYFSEIPASADEIFSNALRKEKADGASVQNLNFAYGGHTALALLLLGTVLESGSRQKGQIVIDVGAGADGILSIRASKEAHVRRIFSIESNPQSFAKLQEALRINKVDFAIIKNAEDYQNAFSGDAAAPRVYLFEGLSDDFLKLAAKDEFKDWLQSGAQPVFISNIDPIYQRGVFSGIETEVLNQPAVREQLKPLMIMTGSSDYRDDEGEGMDTWAFRKRYEFNEVNQSGIVSYSRKPHGLFFKGFQLEGTALGRYPEAPVGFILAPEEQLQYILELYKPPAVRSEVRSGEGISASERGSVSAGNVKSGEASFWENGLDVLLIEKYRRLVYEPYIQKNPPLAALFDLTMKVKELLYGDNPTALGTREHELGVSLEAVTLAQRAGDDEHSLAAMALGAAIHDIGKTKINPVTIGKPGGLSGDELSEIKEHVRIGVNIFQDVRHLVSSLGAIPDFLSKDTETLFSILQREGYSWKALSEQDLMQILQEKRLLGIPALFQIEKDPRALEAIQDIIEWHHETLDGTGYPSARKNEAALTQIALIADITDALTGKKRVYQKELKKHEAFLKVREILTGAEGQRRYDQKIVADWLLLHASDFVEKPSGVIPIPVKRSEVRKADGEKVVKNPAAERSLRSDDFNIPMTALTNAREIMNGYAGQTADWEKLTAILTQRAAVRRDELDRVYGEILGDVEATFAGFKTKDALIGAVFSEAERNQLESTILKSLEKQKAIRSDLIVMGELMKNVRIAIAKRLVLGDASVSQEAPSEVLDLSKLTPEAKALLRDRRAIEQVFAQGQQASFKFSETVVLGTRFFNEETRENVEKFFREETGKGRTFKLVYDHDDPYEAQLAPALVQLFPGGVISAIPNDASRRLSDSKLRGGDVRFGFLPGTTAVDPHLQGDVLVFGSETLFRQLVQALDHDMASGLNAVELMRQFNSLHRDKAGRLIFDQSALDSFVRGLNQLAEARRAVEQAA